MSESVMKVMGSRQASNRFGSVINLVQEGGTVKITRNGRDVAFIISPLVFEALGGEKKMLEVQEKAMEEKRKELKKALYDMQEQAEKNGLTQDILNDIINEK